MGSGKVGAKEFEQINGSLGGRPKSVQSTTNTMAQSFRSSGVGENGAFGGINREQPATGGAFSPMSQGLGGLSSTDPIQCAKKKKPEEAVPETSNSKMDNYFNTRMLIRDYSAIGDSLLGYKSRRDMGGQTTDASEASYNRMVGIFRAINNGDENQVDNGGLLSMGTAKAIGGEANASNIYNMTHGSGSTSLDRISELDFTRRLALSEELDGAQYRNSADRGQQAYNNMITTATAASQMGTKKVGFDDTMNLYSRADREGSKLSPDLLSGTMAEQQFGQNMLSWQAPWEMEEPKKKKHFFRRWLNK